MKPGMTYSRQAVANITDENMTRFNITLAESVKMVEWAINHAKGGEIFVPKLKSYKILDLLKVINPKQ